MPFNRTSGTGDGTSGSGGGGALTHYTHTATSGTITINMDLGELQSIMNIDGNTSLITSNMAAGKRVAVRMHADGTQNGHAVSWPMGWVWISNKPFRILDGETMVVSLTAMGTGHSDIVAAAAPATMSHPQNVVTTRTVTATIS